MSETLQFLFNLDVAMSNGFTQTMRVAQDAFGKVQESAQKLNQAAGKMENFARLKELHEKNKTSLQALSEQMTQAKTRMEDARATAQDLAKAHATAQAKVQELSKTYPKNSKEVKKAEAAERGLAKMHEDSQKEADRLKREYEKLGREHEKLESKAKADTEAYEKLKAEMREAGIGARDFARRQQEIANAQAKVAKAQSNLKNIREQLTWGNFKGDIMKSAGIVMTLQQPVTTMMNFEQSMANVRAVNNANDTDFAMLREQALTLGRTTQFTAMQAANTQENLARGGFNPNQIRDAMPAVLAMAAAEGLDLAQAGEIVVKTLGGMGYRDSNGNIDASQSVRVADVLANISASSATNIPELGEAMKVAAPVLSQVNASIEQITAMLGSMANQGFTGEQAGTALASSVMRLAKSPKDTWEGLQELGVKIKTRDGKMRQIPDILKGIDAAFKKRNLGETDQVKYLAKIFGLNQGKAMMGLMNASVSGDVDRLEASNMTQAAGSSQRRADIRNNTLAGDLTALSSAWEGFMIRTGKPLEDWARNIVQWITKGLNKITEFMNEHQTLADAVMKIGTALASWKVIKTAWHYGSLLVKLPFAKLGVSLAEGAAQAATTGGKFSGLKWIVSKTWGLIAAHPFVAVSTAAVAAGVLIYENWDKVKEIGRKCLDLWERFKNWWNSWTPEDKTVNISLEESDKMKAEMIKKYGSLDLRPSYMKQSPAPKPNTSSQIDMRPSYMKTYASGGILTRPHIGLVAEAGPEAIIPLRDKSRGREVLSQAANILGMSAINTSVTNSTSSQSSQSSQNITSIASQIGAEPHAFGGIMTRPHIGLVAEAGPEAIIPLRDKSRGREVLAQAANMLGMSSVTDIAGSVMNSTSILDMAGNIAQTAGNITGNTRISRTARSITNSIANSTDIFDMAGSVANSTSTNSNTRDIISMAKTIFSNRSEESYDRNYAAGNSSYSRNDSRTSNSSRILGQPQINITVNASNNNDSQGLAAMIAAKVQEAWQELQERQARLAYA